MLLCNSGFTPNAQRAYLASISASDDDPRNHDLCEGRGSEAVSAPRDDVSGYTFDFVEPADVLPAEQSRAFAGAVA